MHPASNCIDDTWYAIRRACGRRLSLGVGYQSLAGSAQNLIRRIIDELAVHLAEDLVEMPSVLETIPLTTKLSPAKPTGFGV